METPGHHLYNYMSFSKLWEFVMNREAWCAAVHGVEKSDWNKWKNPSYLPKIFPSKNIAVVGVD